MSSEVPYTEKEKVQAQYDHETGRYGVLPLIAVETDNDICVGMTDLIEAPPRPEKEPTLEEKLEERVKGLEEKIGRVK